MLLLFIMVQASPLPCIYYLRHCSSTTPSRVLVRPNLLWRRWRQRRWQRPLLISLRHNTNVLPRGRREALQEDWLREAGIKHFSPLPINSNEFHEEEKRWQLSRQRPRRHYWGDSQTPPRHLPAAFYHLLLTEYKPVRTRPSKRYTTSC